MSSNVEAAEYLVDIAAFRFAVQLLPRLDYEQRLIASTLRLLSVITFFDHTIRAAAEERLADPLSRVTERYIDDMGVVSDAMSVFYNIAANESNRRQMVAAGSIEVLLKVLEQYTAEGPLVRLIMSTMARLATNDEASIRMTSQGTFIFMKVVAP